MKKLEEKFENYVLTTDRSKMDVNSIHDFLSNESGWSKNITIELVQTSINNSLNFGLFCNGRQIGFARVISDLSTIAYLGDIYIIKEYRGRGLSKNLMKFILDHPNLQGLRRWILLTSTANWLYKKYGFTKLTKPELYMELFEEDIYKSENKYQ